MLRNSSTLLPMLIGIVFATMTIIGSSTGSHISCGPNETWTTCGSACEPSCDNPHPTICAAVCVEGCQCRPGFVRSNNQGCVEDCSMN